MVRKVKGQEQDNDRWMQSRHTLKKIQVQLGLVSECASEAEFRQYDHDPRVQRSLLRRLENFYWFKTFEQFGWSVRADPSFVCSLLADMPDDHKWNLRTIAAEKAAVFRAYMMELIHSEPR